jgi:Ca-activated chloride channel family protein
MVGIKMRQGRPFAGTALRIVPALLLLLSSLFLLAFAGAAEAQDKKKEPRLKPKEIEALAKGLPEKYQAWLKEVHPLITQDELKAFFALKEDYQRDAFIKRFWQVRDTYKGTARNEFYDRYQALLEMARQEFETLEDERSFVLLINGAPTVRLKSDCQTKLWPVEIWYWAEGSDALRQEFFVVFYRRFGGGPYLIWRPVEGLGSLFVDSRPGPDTDPNALIRSLADGCIDGDKLAAAIYWVYRQGMGYQMLEAKFGAKPPAPNKEWIASFDAYSTDLPPNAPTLPAKLEIAYPGRNQGRTVLQGLVSVPAAEAGQAQLGEHRSYNFVLNGEILQDGELFENFRYKFDFPANGPAGGGIDATGLTLPLIFQRPLRPGEYNLVVKIEDLNGKKYFRADQKLSVPEVDRPVPAPLPQDAASANLLKEAEAAIRSGETTVQIVRPQGELQTGMLRFETLTTGQGIEKVTFSLDGKPVLTKKKPPFSVELDLGTLPRTRTLVATAFDAAGNELSSDELLINSAAHRFNVRLIEPQRTKRYESSLLAQAETEVPDGEAIERVEFFLNETRVATLYQPPFQQPIVLNKAEPLAYVRAVAYLTDGNATEDLVFINAPEIEEIEVDLVELYTSVVDRQNRPVAGLAQKDFTVLEDGAKQEIVRFERVTDLPIHTALVLDVSASMEDRLDQARQAALTFLEDTIQSKDRAALITFNDRPNLGVKFTKDVTALAGGLAGLKAERGTALYDSIVFSLYYFNGIKGQRAMLLLSDGKDESSRFTYEEALEYARRAGVTLYTIGLGEDLDKRKLAKLADETGGRFYAVKDPGELEGIYRQIEEELRSQYLLVYQSSSSRTDNNFRTIELKVSQPNVEARTIRGYYP